MTFDRKGNGTVTPGSHLVAACASAVHNPFHSGAWVITSHVWALRRKCYPVVDHPCLVSGQRMGCHAATQLRVLHNLLGNLPGGVKVSVSVTDVLAHEWLQGVLAGDSPTPEWYRDHPRSTFHRLRPRITEIGGAIEVTLAHKTRTPLEKAAERVARLGRDALLKSRNQEGLDATIAQTLLPLPY